jgi:beta-glucosidase
MKILIGGIMEKKFFTTLFIALIFGLVLAGCDTGTGENKIETGKMPIPEVPSNDLAIVPVARSDQWWIERHNNRKDTIRLNQKIIFIGDSITHYWETDGIQMWNELNVKYNNKIANLGFSGDQTQHVIWRLKNGEFPQGINPEYIVLMIGTNNAYWGHEPESIAAGIGEIVKIVNENSPLSKIILCSILPRGNGNDDGITKKNNAVNEIIKNYNGYLKIEYLNMAELYINNDGNLKNELFTDQLHLTVDGYYIWKNKIIEIID